ILWLRVRNGSKSHKQSIGSDKAPTQILSINGRDLMVSACDKHFSEETRFLVKMDKFLLTVGLIEQGNFYHDPGHVVQNS
ncbi:hypothetical protein KSS87_022676, partial [Heliosperma pusillum]